MPFESTLRKYFESNSVKEGYDIQPYHRIYHSKCSELAENFHLIADNKPHVTIGTGIISAPKKENILKFKGVVAILFDEMKISVGLFSAL
jgi:hypothetical protein